MCRCFNFVNNCIAIYLFVYLLEGSMLLIFLVLSCPIKCLRSEFRIVTTFVFTSNCLLEGSCFIYIIYVCLCIVVSNTCCVVFVLFALVLCILCCQFLWIVHYFIAPSVFSNVYLYFFRKTDSTMLTPDISWKTW